MIQFYAPDIEETHLLPEGESAHCCRVLRKKEGEEIYVTDGNGHRFLCRITDAHPQHTEVEILQKITPEPERNYRLTLAVAPTKNADRIEWLMEKAVEIGVDKVVLLRCKRSERKVQRSDRLERIIVSAMNQSLSCIKPELVELTDFSKFVDGSEENSQKFFGYCSKSFPKKELVKECVAGSDVIVMIGPEGDFTPEEVYMAVNNGFVPVTFGNKRLRTETAGVFAVNAVNIINQL